MEARRLSVAGSCWTAFAWGLAEATVFFIVPDVFLTRLALRNFRHALIAGGCAVAGAILGGAVFWYLGNHGEARQLFHFLVYVPGINSELITRTGLAMQRDGVSALFFGGVIGHPYKLFAIHAGAQDVSLLKFLLASVGARFGRFALTTTAAWISGRMLWRSSETLLAQLHALVWLTFYLIYFYFVMLR